MNDSLPLINYRYATASAIAIAVMVVAVTSPSLWLLNFVQMHSLVFAPSCTTSCDSRVKGGDQYWARPPIAQMQLSLQAEYFPPRYARHDRPNLVLDLLTFAQSVSLQCPQRAFNVSQRRRFVNTYRRET